MKRPLNQAPSNIAAVPIDVGVPLFGDAQRSGDEFGGSAAPSIPSTPYVKTAVAQYVVPTSIGTVVGWYKSVFSTCGFKSAASGRIDSSQQFHGYYAPGYQNLQIEMVFKPGRSTKSTAIEYYAVAELDAPRPAMSYLSHPKVILVSYAPSGAASGASIKHVTIRDSGDISVVVSALNMLPVQEGAQHCPPGRGWIATLTLRYLHRGSSRVQFTSCSEVQVRGVVLSDGPDRFAWTALSYAVYHALDKP